MTSDDARPWRDAWHDALYGDDGFYRRAEGPAGHFATSAQGIPGVTDVLAQAVLAYAEHCGAEVVVDFACGRGELLSALTRFVAPGTTLVGVDVVARPAGLDERITWVTSPGGAGIPPLDVIAGRRALVIAHEWLDVVPCPVVEVDDGGVAHTVLVTRDGDERLGAPLDGADLAWLTAFLRPPHEPATRYEIGRTRDAAWAALVAEVTRTSAMGSLVLGVDYAIRRGNPPPFGTLTGFRAGADCPPTPDGSCDLTSHVALDSLDVDVVTTQREVLLDLFGPETLAPVPVELATTDPQGYLTRLSARSALGAAVARGGLGDFAWFLHETRPSP